MWAEVERPEIRRHGAPPLRSRYIAALSSVGRVVRDRPSAVARTAPPPSQSGSAVRDRRDGRPDVGDDPGLIQPTRTSRRPDRHDLGGRWRWVARRCATAPLGDVGAFQKRGDVGFVAAVDDRFAGWIWLSRLSHRDPWSGLHIRLASGEAYAYALWVAPEHRPKASPQFSSRGCCGRSATTPASPGCTAGSTDATGRARLCCGSSDSCRSRRSGARTCCTALAGSFQAP